MVDLLIWAITNTLLFPFIWKYLSDWEHAPDPRMRPTPLLLGLAKTAQLFLFITAWVGVVLALVL